MTTEPDDTPDDDTSDDGTPLPDGVPITVDMLRPFLTTEGMLHVELAVANLRNAVLAGKCMSLEEQLREQTRKPKATRRTSPKGTPPATSR